MRLHDSNLTLAICMLAGLFTGCSAQDAGTEFTTTAERIDLLRVRERIVELLPVDDGVTLVHFERSALRYRIDPGESPNAEELLEYAKRALDEGREVCALVDRAGVPPRKDPAFFHLPPPRIVGFE